MCGFRSIFLEAEEFFFFPLRDINTENSPSRLGSVKKRHNQRQSIMRIRVLRIF
jgi:hypothetical protein